MAWLSHVPEAPVWVPGFLTLRGEAVPVLDVAARIHRRPREAELSDLIVIVSYRDRKVGLLVGEVYGVETFDPRTIQPATEDIPHAPYLCGVHGAEHTPALLFDTAALIALSDLPESDQ